MDIDETPLDIQYPIGSSLFTTPKDNIKLSTPFFFSQTAILKSYCFLFSGRLLKRTIHSHSLLFHHLKP
ncbi:hypothetical protein L1887_23563 [Cichorium endivia]|nr:hypothetical protein L1887_23563 [Cichorium endivia]